MKRNAKKDESILKTTLFIPRDLHGRMKMDMETRGMHMSPWVLEAVREKLGKIETGQDVGWGPLAGLEKDDRERIVRYVEILRGAPTDSPLREAVDQNFALYAWAAGKGRTE